jgi:hypothetical protein
LSSDLKRNTELILALRDDSFLLKTQLQLNKDFSKVGLEFPTSFLTKIYPKDEIIRLIENEVATISEQGERQLLQLMYAVDLSEKLFLELTQQDDFLRNISEQILYREAYKVWLRLNYSK